MLSEQVETMLKSQEPTTTSPIQGTNNISGVGLRSVPAPELNVPSPSIGVDSERWRYNNDPQSTLNDMGFSNTMGSIGMGLDDFPSAWEMIGLGIEEPLPLPEAVDELYVFREAILYMSLYRLGIRFTSIIFTVPFQ